MIPHAHSLCALALCLLGVSGLRAQEESPAAAEAKHLYQVALVAIRAGDFVTAEEKLRQASALIPTNALIFFNLAVVRSKTGHIDGAIVSLRRAREIGLPVDAQEAAQSLAAELEYRAEKEARVKPSPMRFEDAVANGNWGRDPESPTCSENSHTITFAEDGASMTVLWAHGVDGKPPIPYLYHVLEEGPNYKRMQIAGEERRTDAGELVVWDLVLLSPNSYCWHRADWKADDCTPPATRCPPQPGS